MSDAPLVYHEFAAPSALRPYVRCLWHMTGRPALDTAPEPIIPDGCAELVLNLGDPFVRHAQGESHHQPLRLVAGQISRAITIQPSGVVQLWGIRFHPWGAAPFFGSSGAEMRDCLVPLSALSAAIDDDLSAVGDARSEREQYDVIVAGLSRRLVGAHAVDSRSSRLIALVTGRREPFTVRGLARHVGLSVRRIELLFRDEIGLSPKHVHRIHRYQHALSLRRASPRLTWSAVATLAGYYDQAHLIHDSQDIAGCTPAELLGYDSGLTEAFLSE
jgi:AraC-like DNA-binding protein